MKKLLFLSIVLLSLIKYPAQAVVIPYDMAPVTIDGVWNHSEWHNAERVTIMVAPNDSVVVHFKHDMNAMYFVFTGKLESASALFPEILFDPQEVKGSAWTAGQWWMHVSATDCESNGKYGDYGNCKAVQPDWVGAPNFTMGAPYTDTVEIKIPFSKIGFNPATQNSMGMAFVVTNTATTWKLWPATADEEIPSTWSQAVVSKFPVGVEEATLAGKVSIVPNPANDVVHIRRVEKDAVVTVYDVAGKVMSKVNAAGDTIAIDCGTWTTGLYYAEIKTEKGVSVEKIVKQ